MTQAVERTTLGREPVRPAPDPRPAPARTADGQLALEGRVEAKSAALG